ncbi:Rieske (2Fe-2S) protein [Shinella sp. CPCC 101442]|uniref:Rieske (2Fe-2S) protein n=1 Tax=Shinella sp. CPCC 101442 TaxID=2932265 RepID=UPI002153A0D5|nr:Rieske (2Fe-2S) protein [Shinella sp. CPCC 101442]MCR6502895.1 Rieske (2Fe-2S) protein [Shinella sp. CPCC 101442]
MPSGTASSWVPVALSSDLPSGTVMPARIPAGPLALWRSQSGHVAASADRCPHRGMSLSHGFVRGETLSCIYHGWSYGQAGNCLRIPAHPGLTPPEAIRTVTHPVAEADGVIWIAVGEPAGTPPALAGLVPLRSLAAFAGIAAIEAAAGTRANAAGLLEAEDIRLLLSSAREGETLIHVLVEADASPAARIAAARAAEGLRRKAEDFQKKGAAR